MDYKFQLPFIFALFDKAGLPKIPIPPEETLRELGKGRNSVVFKGETGGRTYSIKKTLIFFDTPLIKYKEGKEVLFQTGFLDSFIHLLLGPHPHAQTLFGYNYRDSHLYLFREYCPFILHLWRFKMPILNNIIYI